LLIWISNIGVWHYNTNSYKTYIDFQRKLQIIRQKLYVLKDNIQMKQQENQINPQLLQWWLVRNQFKNYPDTMLFLMIMVVPYTLPSGYVIWYTKIIFWSKVRWVLVRWVSDISITTTRSLRTFLFCLYVRTGYLRSMRLSYTIEPLWYNIESILSKKSFTIFFRSRISSVCCSLAFCICILFCLMSFCRSGVFTIWEYE